MRQGAVRLGGYALSCLAVAALITGCGDSAPPLASGTLRGTVFASGPVDGVVVSVYQLDPQGNRLSADPLGESEPTENGEFEIVIGPGAGALLLEARSDTGRWTELWTGAPVTAPVTLSTIVTAFQPNSELDGILITPVTTIGASLALARMDAMDAEPNITQAVSKVFDALAAHFGGADPRAVPPLDPTASGAIGGELTPGARIGFVHLALSGLADDIATRSELTPTSINSASLTASIVEDARGPGHVLDGVGLDGDIVLGTCPPPPGCMGDDCDTTCTLDTNTLRSELAQMVLTFITDETLNQTGLSYPDLAPTLEHIRTNDDAVLFGSDDPGQLDQTPPEVVWESPTPANDSIVQGTVEIRARAFDAVTPQPSLTISGPAGLMDLDGDPNDHKLFLVVDTTTWPDDMIDLTVAATDDAGNVREDGRRFFIDRGPPAIAIDSPTPGTVYGGAILVDATAADTSLVSFVVTQPGGVTDQDIQTGHIMATIASGALADGEHTLTVSAADGAGNMATDSVTFKTDRVPPTVAISSPANNLLTDDAMVTVTGTATDVTSDIASVVVRVNGTSYPATLGGSAGNRTFTASIPLEADACNVTPWFGENSIRAQAFDQAGNASVEAEIDVVYDNCDPTVTVVARDINDERDYLAGFITSTFVPCLYARSPGPATTTLAYDIAGGGAPVATTYKFAINTASTPFQAGACTTAASGNTWQSGGEAPAAGATRDTTANPVVWHIAITDNVDLTDVDSVQFRVKAPTSPSFGPLITATFLSNGPGATHAIPINQTTAPGFDTIDGEWQAQVVVRDHAGNELFANPIRWNHHLLAGPLFTRHIAIAAGDSLPSGSYINPKSTSFGLSPNTAGVGALFSASGTNIVLGKIQLFNGTPYDASVSFTAATTAGWTRTVWTRNPTNGTAGGAIPASCSTGAIRLDNNMCLNPAPTDASSAAVSGTDTAFVDDLDAWQIEPTFGALAACTGVMCEWAVPRTISGANPGQVDVYLKASKFDMLWNAAADGTPADFSLLLFVGPDPRIFGVNAFDWGTEDSGGIDLVVHKFVKYLKAATITYSGSTQFQTRPAVTVPLQTLDAMAPRSAPFSFSATEDETVPAFMP